jgi:hypothetical protein
MSRDVFHFLGERWKKIPEALQRMRQIAFVFNHS